MLTGFVSTFFMKILNEITVINYINTFQVKSEILNLFNFRHLSAVN